MIKTTVPKCPKCRKMPSSCVEVMEGCTEFEVKPDGTLEAYGFHSPGNTLYLEAHCDCGHAWRIRGDRALRLLAEKGGAA